MFVIITDTVGNIIPNVGRNAYDDCFNVVWISQFLLKQYCGLSDCYFQNVRLKYKKALPISHQPKYLSCISPKNGFILDACNAKWRWMLCPNGIYYDYDHIPTRYIQCIPKKRELVKQYYSKKR